MSDNLESCNKCAVPIVVTYKDTKKSGVICRITECPQCHMRTFTHIGLARLNRLGAPTGKDMYCNQCAAKVTKITLVGAKWLCDNCEKAKR